jgi:hypothetical protein
MGRAKTDQEKYPDQYFMSPAGHVKDRIIFHDNPKMPKEGIPFSLNGYAFIAKPGEELDIPRPVRLMLDTRIETESIQDRDGNVHTRNIPRITYTLVKLGVNLPENIPAPEAIAAIPLEGG